MKQIQKEKRIDHWRVSQLTFSLFLFTTVGLMFFNKDFKSYSPTIETILIQNGKTQIDIQKVEMLYSQQVTFTLLLGLMGIFLGLALLCSLFFFKEYQKGYKKLTKKFWVVLDKTATFLLALIALFMLPTGLLITTQSIMWLAGINPVQPDTFTELIDIERLLLREGVPISSLHIRLTISIEEIGLSFVVACLFLVILGYFLYLPVRKKYSSFRDFFIQDCFRPSSGKKDSLEKTE